VGKHSYPAIQTRYGATCIGYGKNMMNTLDLSIESLEKIDAPLSLMGDEIPGYLAALLGTAVVIVVVT
jgi:hypothetical protein